jgi:membrane fusion protein (multidrug efflux system)
VVQRVPVRIALDAKQLADNPLRVGLSMDAEVDVSNKDGKTLADAPRDAALAHMQTYGAQDDAADKDVQRVIAANTGKAGGKSVKAETSANVAQAQPRSPCGPCAVNRPMRAGADCL